MYVYPNLSKSDQFRQITSSTSDLFLQIEKLYNAAVLFVTANHAQSFDISDYSFDKSRNQKSRDKSIFSTEKMFFSIMSCLGVGQGTLVFSNSRSFERPLHGNAESFSESKVREQPDRTNIINHSFIWIPHVIPRQRVGGSLALKASYIKWRLF